MVSNIFFKDLKNDGTHSNILLNKNNLISNCRYLKKCSGGKLCAMVKANAYGHGVKQIVEIAKEEVDCFGVSNQSEAEEIRPLTDKSIIVFGSCENYKKCIEDGISFILLSFEQTKKMVKLYKEINIVPKMHLCINSGMNRYGVKSKKQVKKIIDYLDKNGLELEGIYTHFSSLSTDKDYTQRQKEIFQECCSLIPEGWNTIKHVGGGGTIFLDIKADMYRAGIEIYGYGKNVKKVLSVVSEIVDLQDVERFEHIGYLCGFTAKRRMKVATIPLGYGDGLPRKLSNKIKVEINGKLAKSTGNICMDSFMVDVTNIKCKIGDKVLIFDNASPIAEMLSTTEYEVLTNLSKFRGNRIIY